MIEIIKTELDDVLLVMPKRHGDERGYFCETYNKRHFQAVGINVEFVQDNHSCSLNKGTVRGLHYQSPPFAQSKLVRVTTGRILDVAVDARPASVNFGKHIGIELNADEGAQLFVPEGFLHGFVTLEPDTHVNYKVSNFYDQASDGAVRWDDPDLAIDWGVSAKEAMLSEKDLAAPFWKDFKPPF